MLTTGKKSKGGHFNGNAPNESDADLEELDKRWQALSADIDRYSVTLHQSKASRDENLKQTNSSAWEVWKAKKEVETEVSQLKPDSAEDHARSVKSLQAVHYQAQQERWKQAEAVKATTARIEHIAELDTTLMEISHALSGLRAVQVALATQPDATALENWEGVEHASQREKAQELLLLARKYAANGGDCALAAAVQAQAQRALDLQQAVTDLRQMRDRERIRGVLDTYDTVAKLSLDHEAPPGVYRGIVYCDAAKKKPFARFDLDKEKHGLPFITHHVWDLIGATYEF